MQFAGKKRNNGEFGDGLSNDGIFRTCEPLEKIMFESCFDVDAYNKSLLNKKNGKNELFGKKKNHGEYGAGDAYFGLFGILPFR